VEKAEALVYIYSNSHTFCQKPGANLVRYYDDNIFSEDSNDDGGALSDTDDNNNNDNGGEGYNGDDRDAFDGGEEHPKEYPPINPRNVH
jgi:hypothetical protein